MPAVRPLPRTGSVFVDSRGSDRALRVAWHDEADVVVVSLWHGNVCTGTFRLAAAAVPDLVDTLVDALRHRSAAEPVADAG